VVGGRVVASILRRSHTGDFRANVTSGGTATAYRLSEEEEKLALAACRRLKLDFAGVDLLLSQDGPLLCEVNSNAHFIALREATGQNPDRVVRPVGVGEDYFKRIQAMEFSIANDDGNLSNHLREADIILIGVSRSGKTPLSMYLGYLGFKTANIPLVPGLPVTPQLNEVPRWKIVGLTIDPERLVQIRSRRVRAMGAGGTQRDGYTDIVKIFNELDQVTAIQRKLGCPVIDTTELALEEAAGRVIEVVQRRREAASGR